MAKGDVRIDPAKVALMSKADQADFAGKHAADTIKVATPTRGYVGQHRTK